MTHLLNLMQHAVVSQLLNISEWAQYHDSYNHCQKSSTFFIKKALYSLPTRYPVQKALNLLFKELYIPHQKSPINPTFEKERVSSVSRFLYSLSKEPCIPYHKSPTLPFKRALHSLSKEPYIPYQESPTFPIKGALYSQSKEPYIHYHKSPTIPFKRAQHSISK